MAGTPSGRAPRDLQTGWTLNSRQPRVHGGPEVAGHGAPVPLAVLASGAGSNLAALLGAIEADDAYPAEVVVVGSDRADAGALDVARTAGIPTVVQCLADHPDRAGWEAALVADLLAHRAQIVVLAGFMKVVSEGFLEHWPHRVVNTHPSLLPAFRGAHAVRDALSHGVKVTGATVHLVSADLDAGPIIDQQVVRVRDDDDESRLHDRIRAVEHEMLPRCVRWLSEGRVQLNERVVVLGPPQATAHSDTR